MTVLADILTLAPAIARGATPPRADATVGGDPGVILDVAIEDALGCLDATLAGPCVEDALRWLQSSGALAVWLPEVEALVRFHEGSPSHHKDLWAHTVEVVGRTPAEGDLRWVALLHDIGKVATRAVDEGGRITFHGHERLGAWLAGGIMARFEMPTDRASRIAFIVEYHARVNAYDSGWSDRAVRRLIRDAGEHLEGMLHFSGADYTTKRKQRAIRIRAELNELTMRIDVIRREDAASPVLPPGFGRALCTGLELAPGPHIGEAIAWLESEVAAERLGSGLAPEVYVEAVRSRIVSKDAPQKG